MRAVSWGGSGVARRRDDAAAGYGSADQQWRIPNSPTTRFLIGQATKTVTAAGVLKLVEGEAVRLDFGH
ncbi:MAG: serine hydrolase [Acidobacteria bacterium]|nr:serine hydrolase [Acidobacteriota bacterium]